MLDEIVAPLVLPDLRRWPASKEHGELDATSTTGLREMLGTNPDAIEAWAFDAVTFEHLLERLEPYGQRRAALRRRALLRRAR